MTAADCLTIRDGRGASLVLERWDDGRVSVWIARPGDNDGHSFTLDAAGTEQLAGFLGLRRVEPAVDHHGEDVWFTDDSYIEWLPAGEDAPEGWRRLYVEQRTGGPA